jgi:glutamate synthase domain-containing protein 3
MANPYAHEGKFSVHEQNRLNQQLEKDFLAYKGPHQNSKWQGSYVIHSTDRATPAGLNGLIGSRQVEGRRKKITMVNPAMELTFTGSAGQGFGVFNTAGIDIKLYGEANDSVGKSMDGGSLIIVPHKLSQIDPAKSVLVGNACLYGATGGLLVVDGLVGDRFAIRNSGAEAIVRGAGFNACEYMTGGKIIILGRVLSNIGAGMTGGELFIHHDYQKNVNTDFLQIEALSTVDLLFFQRLIDLINRHSASPVSYNPQEFIKLSPLSV